MASAGDRKLVSESGHSIRPLTSEEISEAKKGLTSEERRILLDHGTGKHKYTSGPVATFYELRTKDKHHHHYFSALSNRVLSQRERSLVLSTMRNERACTSVRLADCLSSQAKQSSNLARVGRVSTNLSTQST